MKTILYSTIFIICALGLAVSVWYYFNTKKKAKNKPNMWDAFGQPTSEHPRVRNFSDHLKTLGKDIQDEVLGKEKAELFRKSGVLEHLPSDYVLMNFTELQGDSFVNVPRLKKISVKTFDTCKTCGRKMPR